MRAINGDRSKQHRAFRQADGRFHDALGQAGRNERLSDAVHDARSEMFLPFDVLSFDEPRGAVLTDQQAIYEAVRDGRSDRAATLMAEPLQRTRVQLPSFRTHHE